MFKHDKWVENICWYKSLFTHQLDCGCKIRWDGKGEKKYEPLYETLKIKMIWGKKIV
jgi:hypothetical protein